MRHALRMNLQRLGHEVHEARSGASALRLLKHLHPDVIVLDHILPGLSGVETVPLLRRAGHLGPIFLFSQLLCDLSKTVTLPLDVWPISKLDQATSSRPSMLTRPNRLRRTGHEPSFLQRTEWAIQPALSQPILDGPNVEQGG